MSAAAPVPFTQGKRPEIGSSPAPASAQPTTNTITPQATIRLPLTALSAQQLQEIKDKNTGAQVELTVQVSVVMALLERTPVFGTDPSPDVPVATTPTPYVNPDAPPTTMSAASVNTFCKRDADGMPDLATYLAQTAGIYKISEGYSLTYEGRSFGNLEVIVGTCSEINLITETFALAAGIRYDVGDGPLVSNSGGGNNSVLGKVVGPLCSVLNPGTAMEATVYSPAAATFFVMRGVGHLCDVMVSTHITKDFGAMADPLTATLIYRPFLLANDMNTVARISLIPVSKKSCTQVEAQPYLVCCATHVVSDSTESVPSLPTAEEMGENSEGESEAIESVDEYEDCCDHFQAKKKKKKKRKRNKNTTALNLMYFVTFFRRTPCRPASRARKTERADAPRNCRTSR